MNKAVKSFNELVKIINKHYYKHNPQFKKKFLDSLRDKAGNNVCILCTYVIDSLDPQK